MNKSRFTEFLALLALATTNGAHANNSILSPRDTITNALSNITIQNKTGSTIQTYGLFVDRLSYVDTPTADCATSTDLYHSGQAAGANVSMVTFRENQVSQLGQNYLYNMLFTALYYTNQTSITPSPCSLPGCSWLGDSTPPKYWCAYVGVLAPSTGNTSTTANAPPYGHDLIGSGYNYNVVVDYHFIGPITCDDLSLNCSVASTQNQAFP